MDQQFESYEKFFKKLINRLKTWVLPGITGKVKLSLISFSAIYLTLSVYPALSIIPDSINYYSKDIEVLLYVIYSNIYILIFPIGVLLMLRKRRAGWMIMSSWIFIGIVSSLLTLYYSKFWLSSNEVQNNLNVLFGFDWRQAQWNLLIYGSSLIYIYSKEIKRVYEVNGFNKFAPVIVLAGWILLDYFLGSI